jgi:hypothetical protein
MAAILMLMEMVEMVEMGQRHFQEKKIAPKGTCPVGAILPMAVFLLGLERHVGNAARSD